jgi:hypothetical protein
MVGGIAICGGSVDVREGRMGMGGGCGTIGGTLAPAISGRRNHDATEAHWKKQTKRPYISLCLKRMIITVKL